MFNFSDYEYADFGDKRLGKRLTKLLNQLSNDISASIIAACICFHQAKAVYRFTANDNISHDGIINQTHIITVRNICQAKPHVVLLLQDTTDVNYTNLKATEGLGYICSHRKTTGLIVHSVIAVGEDDTIYGILAQNVWARCEENRGKSIRRDSLPIEDKESYKWLEGMENAKAPFPEETMAVHICDREADIYELFSKAEYDGEYYICRKRHNRTIQDEGEFNKVDEYLNSCSVAGTISVHVPRDSHTKRKERVAELDIRFGKCLIKKPSKVSSQFKTIEVYVISAVEVNVPKGTTAISWQLITNVPTNTFEEAERAIKWYTKRWKIETFHRVLKDGCKIEELQISTAEKLSKLIAIYSIISMQVMYLGYIARALPDGSCELILSEEEWQILHRVVNKTREVPADPPTTREAVVMIAKLGGFLARNSDGDPGVKVLWRGLSKFQTILEVAPLLMSL